jgi:hypothetical protein
VKSRLNCDEIFDGAEASNLITLESSLAFFSRVKESACFAAIYI